MAQRLKAVLKAKGVQLFTSKVSNKVAGECIMSTVKILNHHFDSALILKKKMRKR